jgi:hypothetical protein
MDASEMAKLRVQIAELRADVREAEDALADARTLAHQHLYAENPDGIGSNESERKHRLELAALLDPTCDDVRVELQTYRRKLGILEAKLDGARDARTEREYELRMRELEK